jgi:hypothetical protein
MINGEFVLSGQAGHPAQQTLRLLTTIGREVVAIHTIHPGEHLAEELEELGMSAAELARQLDFITNSPFAGTSTLQQAAHFVPAFAPLIHSAFPSITY